MIRAVAVCVLLAAPAAAASGSSERFGARGWGVGLELPMVGVLGGFGTESSPGVGYALGAALFAQVVPEVELRLYVRGGETSSARASVRYLERGARVRSRLDASWLGIEAGLGASYRFRASERSWTPFVGVDGGVSFDGYDYELGDELASLAARDAGDVFRRCTGDGCASDIHDALALGPTATVRGGVQLDMLSWLGSQAELAVSYAPIERERVSNTTTGPDVTSVPEPLILVRATFSVRLGI